MTSLNGGRGKGFPPGRGNAASGHTGAVLAKNSNCVLETKANKEASCCISRPTLGN